MPKDFSRTSRIGEVLQRELSVIIQQEMRDPRLSMVTVVDVNVTKDLKIAKVYYHLLDEDPEKIKQSEKILNDASSFLRKLVAERVKIRSTPSFTFIYDETLTRGNRIQKLIDEAISGEQSSRDEDA